MRTLLRNVRLFDGESVTESANVLIDGTRIAETDERPADVEIDGRGKTLLPGLIDAHTHTFDGDLVQALRFGVTTELDMFCLPGNLARQRRLAAERDDVADLRSSGVLATAPGGHPSQIMQSVDGDFGDAVGAFETVGAAPEEFVKARVAEGADYLKIVVDNGSVSGLDLPTLAPETVAALVAAAHDAGLQAIAHAVTVRDALICLDAGVDGLAHVVCDAGPEQAEDLAGRIAAAGTFVVSTLSYFEAVTGDPRGAELLRDPRIAPLLGDRITDRDTSTIPVHPQGVPNAVHAAAALHLAGVPLLAGTDANPWAPLHGASLHRELVLLVQSGLTPVQALAAATSVPARHFALTDRGRVAPGLRADLVLVSGDPTQDITATRDITGIWRNGTRLR